MDDFGNDLWGFYGKTGAHAHLRYMLEGYEHFFDEKFLMENLFIGCKHVPLCYRQGIDCTFF